jgi:hypothetical protein
MDFIFTGSMRADLQEVENSFKISLLPWWDDIVQYIPKMEADMSFRVVPAMVINAYRGLGLKRDLTIQMANMFKTIYFASKIHVLIKDDREGQVHNQELQFTILIGDYIFGRVLKLLLEAHVDQLLDMFAHMICKINEGLIIEYKMAAGLPLREILAQTRGPLYYYAFLSAAQLGDLSPDQSERYAQIGFNLGMFLELQGIDQPTGSGAHFLTEARRLLALTDDCQMPGRAVLEELVQVAGEKLGGNGDGL